ncbi:girdin-like [Cimex lectularius]|uniref:Centrosomal protein of 89 kDa n=1 Tax=Cimex lectularius TaxID=79782 RepID=A0A8I6TFL9_CIMLE|nr:girdin-like [Cimex lectularius]
MMANIPEILVHREMNSDNRTAPVPAPRERRKQGRMAKPVVKEVESKVRIKSNGKPSRRWLAREIEKLKVVNAELQRGIQQKEANELNLIEAKARLESELSEYRSDTSTTNKERMRILSQDVFLLKNLVVKLNKELQRYQEKYQSYVRNHGDEEYTLEISKNDPSWIDGELTVLAPLLVAYEECLKEKVELLKESQDALTKISYNCKELVKANDELREAVKVSETKGNVTYGDWLAVQKEGKMLKEQNTLLLRQLKLNSSKIETLKDSFQTKLNEVIVERDDFFNKYNQTKTELSVLKGRFSVLLEEFEKHKEEDQRKIPTAVHTAYITECKRLFDELKVRYEDEKSSLVRKVGEVETVNEELETKLAKINEERMMLRTSLDSVSTQVKSMKEAFDRAVKDREILKEQLNNAIQFSKDMVLHEEALIKELRQRTEESQFGSKLAGRVESLKRNMKTVEEGTMKEIQLLDADLQMQVKTVGKIKESFGTEISRLKSILKEKNTFIAQLAKKEESDFSV